MITKIVVLDTETTGFEAETNSVLEYASVDLLDIDGWSLSNPVSTLVEFEGEIPIEAKAVHHITEKDVRPGSPGCISFENLIENIIDIERSHDNGEMVYAAHNAKFDASFLPMLKEGWICTYRCALHLYDDSPSHKNQALRYYLGLEPDPELIEGLAPHRAMYDTAVTAQILLKMLEDHTPEELLQLTNTPKLLNICNFGTHRGSPWAEVPHGYMSWMLRKGVKSDDMDVQFTLRHYLGL